ncbi:Omp28-related outer membrane protein [bacterium]|nr:Omp28-related outer membrane protein [bacterium]
MSWPGTDPYYNYNTSEANGRRTFYGVSWVPWGEIDGINNPAGANPNWGNAILARTAIEPEVDIAYTGHYDEGAREGFISVEVTPLGATEGNKTLQVVLIENELYYMGSNGYPNHHNVMRDMIPTHSGTPVMLTAGETSFVDLDFEVPAAILVENAKLVIFVQNTANNNILNALGVPVLSIVVDCDNAIGDIIDFGSINVQDLVKLVSIIMGTDEGSDYCQLAAADLNEDGHINIQDVVMLVEVILG